MARGIAGILSEQYDGIDKLGWAPGRIEIQTAAPITERDLLTPGAFHITQATCGLPSAMFRKIRSWAEYGGGTKPDGPLSASCLERVGRNDGLE